MKADSGDALLGATDYGADGAMALTTCAIGDSYCTQALHGARSVMRCVKKRDDSLGLWLKKHSKQSMY
ncbi:hypothetical protein [Yersinia frederiksenii]|uniref:hypothetical protein n=1 Tax=Yersinia frederiksenii TaxID=29484 RepID=UPI000A4EEB7B|nr:hypothetical protein [Yersinia frederiksenii]